jgi:hypothetical protein
MLSGGLPMSQADESRLETVVEGQHSAGRPYHFLAPSQDDRIRRAFGLSDEAPLPLVGEETLAAYYDYLVATLAMPFEAIYCPTSGDLRQLIHYVRVTELADPRQVRKQSPHGLVCKARNTKAVLSLPLAELGVREDDPNCQLLDDYAYWFVNWR